MQEPLRSDLSGDPDMDELIAFFVGELPRRIGVMRDLVAAPDHVELTRVAHQLKGAGGGYGFPAITDAARALEQLARAGASRRALTEAVDVLERLAQRAERGLQAPLPSR